jgi:hypothetical protein
LENKTAAYFPRKNWLSAICSWSSSLVYSLDFEPKDFPGCLWMMKIWIEKIKIDSKFAEA